MKKILYIFLLVMLFSGSHIYAEVLPEDPEGEGGDIYDGGTLENDPNYTDGEFNDGGGTESDSTISLGKITGAIPGGLSRVSDNGVVKEISGAQTARIDGPGEFRVNGGSFVKSATVGNGNTIAIRLDPPSGADQTNSTKVKVGHITFTFSISTSGDSGDSQGYSDSTNEGPATRMQSCTGLPDNASWNGDGEFEQTQVGTSWLPGFVRATNSLDESKDCTFTCDSGYDWDIQSNKCIDTAIEDNADLSEQDDNNNEQKENIKEDRNEFTEIEKTSVYDEKDLEDNEKNLEKPEESTHDSFENEGEIQKENEDIKEKQPSKEQEKKVEGLNLEYTQYDKLPKDLGIKYNMYASRDLYNITNYMSYMEPTLEVVSWTEKKTKSYLDSLRVTTIKYLLGKNLSDKEERLFKIYRSRIGEHTIQTEKKDFGRYFKLQLSTENPALKLVQKLLDKEINKNMKSLNKNQIPKAYRLRNHLMILLLTIVEQDDKDITTRAKKQAVDVVKQMAKLGII